MLVRDFRITDYAHAKRMLGGKDQRTVCNNTVLTWADDLASRDIWLELHEWPIVQWTPDGKVYLYTRSYNTRTTKNRLHKCCPNNVGVWQHKGIWYVGQHRSSPDRVPFYEGIDVSEVKV